jgi:hypothetical protein
VISTGGTGNIGSGGTTGMAGGAPGSGGLTGGTGTGGSGAGGAAGGSTGSGGSTPTGGSGGSTTTGSSLSIVASWPNGAIFTGVRDQATPLLTQMLKVHNGGTASVAISALTVGGAGKAAFQINGAPQLPMNLAAGADLSVTVQALTASSALAAAPPQNSGATFSIATLTATAGGVSATANLYSLMLFPATHEPTLGQILIELGYKMNVGVAQNDANPIMPSDASKLPKGIEAGTDEIAAPLFVKAGTGNVTMDAVARFSPEDPIPFGWYPKGTPGHSMVAGTMAATTDMQTSNGARMVLPPVTGTQAFDPGATVFGLWVFSDQVAAGAGNGDYDYSEDAPNTPAGTHRTKVYPLKDVTGTPVANSFLIAVEEAGNGDYQDYVFVLGNAKVAP